MELNQEVQECLFRLKDDPFWQYLSMELRSKEDSVLDRLRRAKSWEEVLRAQGEWQALQFFHNTVESVKRKQFQE